MIQYLEKKYNINLNDFDSIINLKDLRKEVQEYRNKYNKNLEYKKKYLCIICNNDKYGSGFFASITYKSKPLNVLITNNNIIDNNKIEIYLNYENNKKIIYLNNQRKKYSNKEMNLFIIEIKESDKIKYFLKVDKEIMNYYNSKTIKDDIINYFNEIYINNLIFTLNYKDKYNIFISNGLLSGINEEGIEHTCKMGEISFINEKFLCSPILLLKSKKLIGFYNGGKSNYGKLIIFPIIEFNKIPDIIQQEYEGKVEIKKNLNMINEFNDDKEQDNNNENKKKEINNNFNENQINHNIYQNQNNYNIYQNQNNMMFMNNNLNNNGMNNYNMMMGMNINQNMKNNYYMMGMNNNQFMMNNYMMGMNNQFGMNNCNMMGMNNNQLMMNNMFGMGNQLNMNYNNINYLNNPYLNNLMNNNNMMGYQ